MSPLVPSASRDPKAVRPFPWGSLDSTTAAQEAALGEARQWAAAYIRMNAFEAALRELVDARVEVLVRRTKTFAEAGSFGDGFGLALADGDAMTPLALVQAEPALVADVVARALRRPRLAIVDSAARPAAALAGAFAAIFAAAARRSHASGPLLRVISAGAAGGLESEFTRPNADAIALVLTVLLGDEAYAARVLVARGAIAKSPPRVWNASALSTLGSTPLSLPLVASTSRTTVADVAALRTGDVLLPGAWPLARAGEGWRGPVWISAPRSSTGIGAELGEGGTLVLRGGAMPIDPAEADMDDSGRTPALVEAVGEVPVVVRVEIGEARMAAKEWASLRRGDVVTLGQRVGSRVALRVAGVVVARGELVEIDGEVGVRVVERLAEEGS